MTVNPQEILKYWFEEIGSKRWFIEDSVIDKQIVEKYLTAYEAAVNEELKEWEETPEGMIALLLLLNIFPRHMFRGTPRAYETDDNALELARIGIIKHFDDRIDRAFKLFFYMPFSHSEHIDNQRLATFYIRERTKEPAWVDYVNDRRQLIEKFGRFPQRNEVLGRETTAEEDVFLKEKTS